jgi:3-oxoacyl-[acyl-carrier protein] reductase
MSLMTWTFTAVASQTVDTGLAGKRVLVTGASGGIGAACARAFASEGASVVVHYRGGRDRAEVVAGEIGGEPVGADLTVENEVDALFAAAGTLDVCAAVVGEWPRDDVPVWELSLERWDATLRANLTSAFLTARGFLRSVAERGHGSLVFVGSTAGSFGEAGHADYAAAKAAVVGLMLSVKNEVVRVAPLARVNAVFPGWTESPMTRGVVDPEQVRRVSRTMALRKVAQPEDVARQIVVLASDELSGHVTGQIVTVAGGMEGRTIHDE